MSFEFCTSPRIVYGRGSFDQLGPMVAPMGKRAMVVRGGGHLDRSGVMDRLRRQFEVAGIGIAEHMVRGEPDVSTIDEALEVARSAGCELVVGLGGGSALDAAKAVAGLLTMGGEALDYMEVVGRGQAIDRPAAPLVAVPTTAGTGTEVTRNAVLAFKEKRFKASMRSPHLIPRVALVDPQLTDSTPPQVTASTGLDALTQLIEPYVSRGAMPMTDGLSLEGIRRAAGALPRAYADGSDAAARDDMSLASLFGGICLANAGLGAVHGFAAPLGAMFPVPHGMACAALLPHVMEANVHALRLEGPDHPVLARYATVGRALTGRAYGEDREAIDAGVEFVQALVRELSIPALSVFGLGEGDVEGLVASARKASSMKYNPIELSDEALTSCVRGAL